MGNPPWQVARTACEECQNWPLGYNSGMPRLIVIKFGVCLETKSRCILLQVIGWGTSAHAHVQMCPIFRISETAEWIALKFGRWLETH